MNDIDYMKLALQIAKSTRGQTSPNPIVGSVVVKDGQIVGIGAHLKAGEGHAEVQALKMAGEKARGATIYVTLEPCSHYGKTPPCADLIIERGIKRAVIATTDPNPKVAGNGIQKLKDAGIEVVVGVCREEADKMNAVFFHYIKTKRPYVTLKTAMTLDGKIATKTGESKWITSGEAREDAHYYRHVNDAILVGVGTVIADDPSLTTRLPLGGKQPIRIVLDRHLRTPLKAKLVQDQLAPTWIITTEHASEEKEYQLRENGVRVIRLPDFSLSSVLNVLGEQKITSLFVEGGAEISGSFLKEQLVHQWIIYVAPKAFGGRAAPSAVAGEGIAKVKEAFLFEWEEVTRIGPDLKLVLRSKGGE